MKRIDEIIDSWSGTNSPYINKQDVRQAMKEYAVEAINELVDEMLANPPNALSEMANMIHIANRIKREIHGVTIEQKDIDGTNN